MKTLQLLSVGPRRQASARTSAESEEACQRKTKDRADGMREKSAHCPRRDSNLYLWDTRPPCCRLHHEGRARLASAETNTLDTHPSAPPRNNHAWKHSNSYLRDRDVKHLQGPPLSRKKRVRERRKIELTVWGKKVPIALDGIRTCTSGIRAHHAADYTTKVGPASRQSKRTL